MVTECSVLGVRGLTLPQINAGFARPPSSYTGPMGAWISTPASPDALWGCAAVAARWQHSPPHGLVLLAPGSCIPETPQSRHPPAEFLSP